MVVAKRFRRILVWPNFDIARAADEAASADSKLCNRLTVWPTDEEAVENAEFDEGGEGGGGDEDYRVTDDAEVRVTDDAEERVIDS